MAVVERRKDVVNQCLEFDDDDEVMLNVLRCQLTY